jgi:hypothetical protein
MRKNEFVELRKKYTVDMLQPKSQTSEDQFRSFLNLLKPQKTNIDLIRLGPEGDGGYLIPDDLQGIAACFSPGVGTISGFEEDCLKKKIKVFCADKSLDNKPVSQGNFHFLDKFIGGENNTDFITLEEWVKNSCIDKNADLMLQMDIQGFEYDALEIVHDFLLNRFRIVVIEFHFLDLLIDESYFKKAEMVFKKLLKNHFCVHLHPNNCCGTMELHSFSVPRTMEFTFFRKNRCIQLCQANEFPHKLDYKNTQNADLHLPECWYSKY